MLDGDAWPQFIDFKWVDCNAEPEEYAFETKVEWRSEYAQTEGMGVPSKQKRPLPQTDATAYWFYGRYNVPVNVNAALT